MGRTLFNKLGDRRGETLTETLVSILVIALSAAILATTVMAAVKLNTGAKAANEEMYAALDAAATGAVYHAGTVSVSVEGAGAGDGVKVFSVNYSGGGDLSAYVLAGA